MAFGTDVLPRCLFAGTKADCGEVVSVVNDKGRIIL
jgi:hypothetical protein